jgi:major type 1 subunit fimbrin (pilin)
MLIRRLSLAVLMAAASQVAQASPATSNLQFDGAVKSTTCTVSVDGVETPNPATVVLQDARVVRLAKEGDTDGKTGFSIDLKNCPNNYFLLVHAMFKGGNGTTVTNGRLDNMASLNPAKNVQLQLRRNWFFTNGIIDVGSGNESSTPSLSIWNGAATLDYTAEYYATGAATQGNLEAATEFTIQYH